MAPDAVALPRFLLGLTFVTGMVDAVSFLGLGQVFAAMMTGNVLFLGFGIAGAAGASLIAPLIALAAFLVGGAAGSLISARSAPGPRRGLIAAVAIEVGLIVLAASLAAAMTVEPDEASAWSLLAVLAAAMGLRNSVVRRLGPPELITTVLTITVTRLEVGSELAGASGERLAKRWGAVAAMLLGALAGALLLKTSPEAALAVAAIIAAVALALYAGLTRGEPAALTP